MSTRATVEVGVTLQPDERYLDLLQPVFDLADYFEVAPETTWRRAHGGRGGFEPNGFFHRFLDEGRRRGRPFVAHCVHGSLGTADARDRPRQREWLERLRLDQQQFEYRWLTDHLGASVLGERAVALPVALPMTDTAAELVRERLVELQQVVPDTGFENSAFYFLLGDWQDEPSWFSRILAAPRTHLLLDLHNVFTIAQNLGEHAVAYVDRLDLSRVIEIHLSGGVDSPPSWLPDGRSLRLDSHDAAIPAAVWELFEHVVLRCSALRGVTVERMEGSVAAADVDVLRREVERAREVLRHAR